MIPRDNITGVILAGGQSRRMGGADKGLIAVHGKSLLRHVIDAIAPQTGSIIISANRNLEHYAVFGYPVIQDTLPGHAGPLAGMASAMLNATTDYVLAVPCDAPYLPADLAIRLYLALIQEQAEVAVVHDGQRMQPVAALLQCELANDILESLQRGHNKTERWMKSRRLALVDFSDKIQAFENINSPENIKNLT